MGFDLRDGRSRNRMVSEINVTPLVDVMLVLLIIFMVATPMMIQGIDVQLPEVAAHPISSEPERVVVGITATGETYVNDTKVDMESLGLAVSLRNKGLSENEGVILKADRKVEYGVVAQAMGTLRKSGIERIGMVTEPMNFSKGQGDKESLSHAATSPGALEEK